MTRRHPAVAGVFAVALGLSLAAVSACHLSLSLDAEARDQWSRTYELEPGGTFEIRNTNGEISIETTDGTAIEVSAEFVVKAATDEAAKELLDNSEITETVSPGHILLDSRNRDLGFTLHVSRSVNYTVRLPKSTNVTLDSTNGDIEVSGLAGALRVDTTNGRIRARALENGATVGATNGQVTLEFLKLGEQGIECETTNGSITVDLPRSADASVSARVTNGRISTSDLGLSVSDDNRRRLEGSIGAGGTRVRLRTTNGAISLRGR